MVFSSAPFIFVFLPIVFLIYSLTPGLRGKNVVLTIASLFFYAYGEPVFVFVMIGSVIINYLLARAISAKRLPSDGRVPSDGSLHTPKKDDEEWSWETMVKSHGGLYGGSQFPEDRAISIGRKRAAEATDGAVSDAVSCGSDTGNGRKNNKDSGRWILALAVILNLAMIGVFKYAGFAVESINAVTGLGISVPSIGLPIGISFFTFQILSYVIDVYREPDTVQKDFGKLLLYVSFFPQLIAGPIVKYHDISAYLTHRERNTDETAKGIQRFIIGLAKKMLIANTMSAVADLLLALDPGDMSTGTAWIGAICFTMHIFFDFSGYSDMAIGMGHMFGFTIKENFDHPYISTSIKEFWRRWHVSLSTWFREYLYIPLGGNRKGKPRMIANKLLVFFCTGLWHGASWNFVIWGMIHGFAMMGEDIAGREERLKKLPVIGWLYTMIIVVTAFVLFWAGLQDGSQGEIFAQGMAVIKNMFIPNPGDIDAFNRCMEVIDPYRIFIFAVAVVVCIPIKRLWTFFIEEITPASALISMLLFVLCILNIAGAGFNPFIYFRF